MSSQPVPRQGDFSRPTVTPAERIMADLPGVYYRLSEAAELVGKSQKTLRRLIRKNRLKAPSATISVGEMQMYLYTPEDIEELRDYYYKEPSAHDPA